MSDKISWKEKRALKKEEKQRIKIEKQELKKEHKKVEKVVVDLLPFLNVHEDYFETKNGYLNIYQISTKDLKSLNNEEVGRHIFEFSNFARRYSDDFKIICMQYPVNTQLQQEHIINKIKNTSSHKYIKALQEELEKLKALEQIRKNKEFYLMLFFKDERDKKEKEIYLNRKSSNAMDIRKIDLDKKIKILYKLNNQNSKI